MKIFNIYNAEQTIFSGYYLFYRVAPKGLFLSGLVFVTPSYIEYKI